MSFADDFLDALSGTVFDYAGASQPNGFLFCNGQAVSRSTYSRLFNVIGTTYGAGDGTTTFNVPDLRGRVVAGKDDMGGTAASRLTTAGSGVNGATLGAVGGAETHTLSGAEIPAHTHPIIDHGHTHSAGGSWLNVTAGGNVNAGSGIVGFTTIVINSATTGVSVDNNTGGGGAHNITQPTGVLNKIIKT